MNTNKLIAKYLSSRKEEDINPSFLAYLSSLGKVAEVAPKVARSIINELRDQRNNMKLIASENFCSLPTQLAMGNLLTDKYSEGFPGHRFYAGCDNVDDIETYACEEACKLFGAENAYVQPHSGADANLIAFWTIINTRVEVPELEKFGETNPSKLTQEDWEKIRTILGNQKLLGMDYYSGGHLTHGYRHNVSAKMFDAYVYGVNKETGIVDYKEIEECAKKVKPLILLAGYSAYPRKINFARFREIADKVGAVLMVDMAHFAGLVAGGVFKGDYNPIPFAQVVTSTTHKTLRGPRGGLVLCDNEFSDALNKGCPLVIGGPLPHVIAAKAVAFTEANTKAYKQYTKRIVENSTALAEACVEEGMELATGGTDNHLMLIDVRPFGLNGRQAEAAVRGCGITLNRNALPYDPNGPWYTSGLRIGTPAITTLGMGKVEMKEIAKIISIILKNTQPKTITTKKGETKNSKSKHITKEKAQILASEMTKVLLKKFPLYPELDLEYLQENIL